MWVFHLKEMANLYLPRRYVSDICMKVIGYIYFSMATNQTPELFVMTPNICQQTKIVNNSFGIAMKKETVDLN